MKMGKPLCRNDSHTLQECCTNRRRIKPFCVKNVSVQTQSGRKRQSPLISIIVLASVGPIRLIVNWLLRSSFSAPISTISFSEALSSMGDDQIIGRAKLHAVQVGEKVMIEEKRWQ